MNEIEKAAITLRQALSKAELSGQLKEREALPLIEALHQIEKLLEG